MLVIPASCEVEFVSADCSIRITLRLFEYFKKFAAAKKSISLKLSDGSSVGFPNKAARSLSDVTRLATRHGPQLNVPTIPPLLSDSG